MKPEVNGIIKFPDNTFDLITCFSALHHICNVTFVLGELIRVLKPGGYMLIREPIVSMGDWNYQRRGLTKNERGIPTKYFEAIFKSNEAKIEAKTYCFTAPGLFGRTIGKFLRRPYYAYKSGVKFDKIISFILKFNYHYSSTKSIHKLAPSSVFYVVCKIN